MSTINDMLAQAYGTFDGAPAAAPSEDAEKLAQFELFAKTAAANGIDLEKVTPEEMEGLFTTFQKKLAELSAGEGTAAADPAGKPDLEKKAAAEFEQIKEAQAKVAEADFLGQVMAHSYVATLKKIASSGGFKLAEEDKKDEKKEEKDHKNPFAAFGKEMKGKKDKEDEEEKKASALDLLAGKEAVKIAAAANFDPEEAGTKLDALFSSGKIAATTKTASAKNVEEARHVRALELLEQCGYPVTW